MLTTLDYHLHMSIPALTDEQRATLEAASLTRLQERTVAYLLSEGWRNAAGHGLERADAYEVKELRVEHGSRRDVWVTLVMGRKGDEGTLASLLCRARAHVRVGPHGGALWYRRTKSGKSVREGSRRDLWRAFYAK
jgi:hypothetical protein